MQLTPTEQALVDAAARDDQDEVQRLAETIDAEEATRQARLNGPAALLDAALWYASQGFAVFPCRPGGKAPLTSHGFKDATTDLDQVRAWWTATPDANIGLPTGLRFDVFDVDGPEGTIALGEVKDAGGMPDVLAWCRTPRGMHYYVAPSGHGNTTSLLPKVDHRGLGGYVVAPPSRTADGAYRWIRGNELGNLPLPTSTVGQAA